MTDQQVILLNQLRAIAPDSALYTLLADGSPVAIGASVGRLLDLLHVGPAGLQRLLADRPKTASRAEILAWSDAIADCTCWFKGFMAAKGDAADGAMPPGWRTLIEINIAINEHLSDTSDSRGAETALPF